ncbi:MAG: bifunctional 2-polyprenyl-6-hydroxyphenol methylase/3-demethylubiquinol 3-O-methyltransferase UbiG [Pseudomonadota bacterium]
MTGRVQDVSIYDDVAADWWSGNVRWLRTLQSLVPARLACFDREIDDWHRKSVLDLGCGGGFMAEAMAKRGAQVTGLDPAADAIAAAERHAAETGLNISYLTGTAEALPFDDASFDIVVCVDVFEHLEDLDAVLAEIARVLKPGGQLAFDTINATLIARVAMVLIAENLLGLLPKGTHDPAGFIKPADLLARLDRQGLQSGALNGLGPIGIGRRFDPVFGRLPLKAILYAGVARKF